MSKKAIKGKKNYVLLGANIPVELNDKIVERANEIGISKTSLVILILNGYFEGNKFMKSFNDGIDMVKKGKL